MKVLTLLQYCQYFRQKCEVRVNTCPEVRTAKLEVPAEFHAPSLESDTGFFQTGQLPRPANLSL